MTDPGRHQRMASLFAEARALPKSERAAFLRAACPDDESLVAEVLALLEGDETPHRVLDTAPGHALRQGAERALAAPAGDAPPMPARIGQYTLIGLIGEGGMGRVYEAEQDRPRRRVALKVLAAGAFTPEARRRFELEAEIVGRLQHPGIAQVLEAGVADIPGLGTQPYLAMELVRGSTLMRHVEENHLPLARRLELLALACDALQHAHERGIVHRDLKPANILVDQDGRPRIVDFGIARIIDPQARMRTMLTVTGHLLGTLAYMAPEQVRGRSAQVDARTDVYALGAIGWELAVGRPPHDLADASLPEAARRIVEDEVPRLSSIDRGLRGDLETILAKALEKDPARRYASASELAADLRRHLADEPIFARPASAVYQLRRFARRHVGVVIAASLAVVALIGGTAAALWQAGEARQRAREAEHARDAAEALAYRAGLSAAVTAIDSQSFLEARQRLADVPAALRGWEWDVLSHRCAADDGVLPGGELGAWLVPTDYGGTQLSLIVPLPGGGTAIRRIDAAAARVLDETPWKVGFHRPVVIPAGLAETAIPSVGIAAAEDAVEIRDPAGNVQATVRRCMPRGRVEQPLWKLAGGLRLHFAHPAPGQPDGDGILCGACDDAGNVAWRTRFDVEKLAPALVPSGERVAFIDGKTGRVEVRDARDGRLVVNNDDQKLDLVSACVSRDEALVITGSNNGGVLSIYDGRTLATTMRRAIPRTQAIRVALAGDDRILVTSGPGNSVMSWPRTFEAPIAVLPGSTTTVTSILDVPELRMVVTTEAAGTIRKWSYDSLLTDRSTLAGHGTYVYAAGFSPDASRILVATFDDKLHGWDGRTRQRLWIDDELVGSTMHVPGSLGFAADGMAVVAYSDGMIARVDASAGRVVQRCDDCDADGRLAFDPARRLVASATRAPGIFVRDATDLRVVTRLDGLTSPLAWSTDGGTLLACDAAKPGDVVLLDARTFAVTGRFPTGDAEPAAVAMTADGSTLVLAFEAGRAEVRHRDGRLLATIAHPGRVLAVTFSPAGDRLFIGGDGGDLRVFETRTWSEVVSIPAHESYVYSLTWAPDGRTLLTTSGDGTVRVWEPG